MNDLNNELITTENLTHESKSGIIDRIQGYLVKGCRFCGSRTNLHNFSFDSESTPKDK